MNRLASETSPYLRQHADNPVDWYAWGDEAFDRARELDRPVMLSVGYSSCHWCHVMAHESFEDPEVADALNGAFVSVKVDREERPDVDAIYMDAVQAISGHGGWPMTVFLTPDARPFYAGTYFPAHDRAGMPSFRKVIAAVEDAWRNRRTELQEQAEALTRAVATRSEIASFGLSIEAEEDTEDDIGRPSRVLRSAVAELSRRFDRSWGGFGPAPKFPHPGLVELCLQDHRLVEEETSLVMATGTLAAMAAGGIYDHLGGGFHRYSTDTTWTVPHFEKMLYDQAGLVRAYLHGWLATGERQWLGVVEETITYVLRDLSLPSGGVASAEDADSQGEEGLFYTWDPAEIRDALPPDLASEAISWYGVTDTGNFEGRSILRRPLGSPLARPEALEDARRLLLERRSMRPRPGRDDKVLTEWNAMFGSALCEAAGATARSDWEEAAQRIAEFLLGSLRRSEDGRWLRSWQDGRARHLAYSADYAWIVDFFTRLAELTGSALWLERASQTAASMLSLFGGEGPVLYTTGSDSERLIVRPVELADGATPSATSVAACALLRLAALSGDPALAASGESLLSALLEIADRQPLLVAEAVGSGFLSGGGTTEVVIAGERPDLLAAVRGRYEPYAVVAWGERTGSPLWEGRQDGLAYVCRGFQCQLPSTAVEQLEERLDIERASERARYVATIS